MFEIGIYGSLFIVFIWLMGRLNDIRKENRALRTKLEMQDRQIRHLVKPGTHLAGK